MALMQAAQCEVNILGARTRLTWVQVLTLPFASFTELVHGPSSVLVEKTGIIIALCQRAVVRL